MRSNRVDYDLSELDAVDKALGCHIVDSLRVLSKNCGSHSMQKFLNRESYQQVFRGEAEDPRALVQSLRMYGSQKKAGGEFSSSIQLPVIWYYRDMNMTSAEADDGNQWMGACVSSDGSPKKFRVSMSKFLLSYRIAFVAHDKNTAQRLALAWHFWVSDKVGGQHKFTVSYRIQDELFELPCVIQDPQTLTAENISVDHRAESRLFALQVSHDVLVPALYGRQVVTDDPIRWQIGFKTLE